MEYKKLKQEITENVRSSHERNSISRGEISSTTLGQDDNGYFASYISDDEDKPIGKSYFQSDVSHYITKLVDYVEENCSFEDQSSLDTDVVLFLEDEPTLYINISSQFYLDHEVLGSYLSEFATSNEYAHNVTSDNVEKLVLRYSPVWNSFDSTCYYRTEEPHKPYANIDSFDDYIDRMSDQSDLTEEELRDKKDYVMHYHPHDEEVFSAIQSKCISNLSGFCIKSQTTIDVQPTTMVIEKHEDSEITMTDINKGELVNNQL